MDICIYSNPVTNTKGLSQLTGDDIKAMIQCRIDLKQREIKPHKESKGSGRPSNRFRSTTCALSLITDEEELREIIAGTRSGP